MAAAQADRRATSCVVGIYLGRSFFSVATGALPDLDTHRAVSRVEMSTNALGARATPLCVAYNPATTDGFEVGEGALSRLASAPRSTFDRITAPVWGLASDTGEDVVTTVAARLHSVLSVAGSDAARNCNRRDATSTVITVPPYATPALLHALEQAIEHVCSDSSSPFFTRGSVYLAPTCNATLAGTLWCLRDTSEIVPHRLRREGGAVIVVRVGTSSLDASLIHMAQGVFDQASSTMPWSTIGLPSTSCRVVSSDDTTSDLCLRLQDCSVDIACGLDLVDDNIIATALQLLSPEAASGLQPRVRMRWLRSIRAAREIVARGAPSESLELELAGETAAFDLTTKLLRHCCSDVIAAVRRCVMAVCGDAGSNNGTLDVSWCVVVGGGASLPGVVDAITAVIPGVRVYLHPEPTTAAAIGAVTLAGMHLNSAVAIGRGMTSRDGTKEPWLKAAGNDNVYFGVSVALAGGRGDHVAWLVPPSADLRNMPDASIDLAATTGTSVKLHFALVAILTHREGSPLPLCELGACSLLLSKGSDPPHETVLSISGRVTPSGEHGNTPSSDGAIYVSFSLSVARVETNELWQGIVSNLLVRPPLL